MGVPAESALDALAHLGLEASDGVLDVAGQEVAVVRQAVGEGRAVVEDELVAGLVAVVDGGLEGAVGLPVGEDVLLDGGEGRRGLNRLAGPVQGVEGGARVGGGRLGGAGRIGGSGGISHRGLPRVSLVNICVSRGRRRPAGPGWQPARGRAPRYHLACRAPRPQGGALRHRRRVRVATANGARPLVRGCTGPSRPGLVGRMPTRADRLIEADDVDWSAGTCSSGRLAGDARTRRTHSADDVPAGSAPGCQGV